jgi:hypothetical protein
MIGRMAAGPRAFEVDARGRPVPCVLWELDDGGGAALVLPGGARSGNRLGGTPARPDLHYTRALLLELGLSVLELWWDAETAPLAHGDEADAWLAAHAEAGVRAASQAGDLRVLVGRSFGTCALARIVRGGEAPAAATIWIAPLLGREDVRAALEEAAPSAFVVGGTADESFDLETAEALRGSGARLALVEGANHGLEAGGAAGSARALADVLDAMRAFLGPHL